MGGGGGCLPEVYGGGCCDDCVVDDGCESGGVLVAEGEHGLIVGRVSDIDVGYEGKRMIAVSGPEGGLWRGVEWGGCVGPPCCF